MYKILKNLVVALYGGWEDLFGSMQGSGLRARLLARLPATCPCHGTESLFLGGHPPPQTTPISLPGGLRE